MLFDFDTTAKVNLNMMTVPLNTKNYANKQG